MSVRSFGLGVIAAAGLVVAASQAQADTIDFSQFSGTLGNAVVGTTMGSVSVTITAPNAASFSLLIQDNSWAGDFISGSPVLFDGGVPGLVTLTFATPISALTLAVQSNDYGAFTATETAYNGLTVVDTQSVSGTSSFSPGTVPLVTVTGAADITSVTIGTTNDAGGFALYGGAGAPGPTPVPEPASLALIGAAIAGLGAVRRKRAARSA